MKNEKTRNTMMVIAGGYLVYLGFTLIQDVLNGDAIGIQFLLFGILFITTGGILVVKRLKDVIQLNYEEATQVSEEEATQVSEEEAETGVVDEAIAEVVVESTIEAAEQDKEDVAQLEEVVVDTDKEEQ